MAKTVKIDCLKKSWKICVGEGDKEKSISLSDDNFDKLVQLCIDRMMPEVQAMLGGDGNIATAVALKIQDINKEPPIKSSMIKRLEESGARAIPQAIMYFMALSFEARAEAPELLSVNRYVKDPNQVVFR